MSNPRLPKGWADWRIVFAILLIGLATPLASVAPASAAPDYVWDELAQCEASGNWRINTGNGFHGGLQFAPSTWSAYAPPGYPAFAYQATREQQIVVGERVLAAQGWGAWPSCSARLGLYGYGVDLRDPESAMPVLPEPEPEPAPPAPEAPPASPCDPIPWVELKGVLATFCYPQ